MADNGHSNWLSGVAATGTFTMRGLEVKRGVSFIPEGWTVEDKSDYLTFTALEDNSTIALNKSGTPATWSSESPAAATTRTSRSTG